MGWHFCRALRGVEDGSDGELNESGGLGMGL